MRHTIGTAALCLAIGAVALTTMPAVAAAAAPVVFRQGAGGTPFQVVNKTGVVQLGGGGLGTAVGELAAIGATSPGYQQLGVAQPDPVSAQALSGGDVLVTDEANRLVAEFSSTGSLVWSYRIPDSASAPVSARSLTGGSVTASDGSVLDGLVLICDQGGDRVFVIDANASDQVVWQYGATDSPGGGVDRLSSPLSAEWLPIAGATGSDFARYGNVAICDAGNHRVIVVRAADYTGAGSEAGFGAQSIVWQYGNGTSGTAVDELETPTSVQRLDAAHGDMLICDRQAARVIEVDAADYDASAPNDGFTAKSVVWQFSSSGGYTLQAPTCALGSFGGDSVIWIADAGLQSPRVLGVATGTSDPPTGHRVFADYATGSAQSTGFTASLSKPASLSQVAPSDANGGSLVVADPGEQRVVTIGTAGSGSVRLASSALRRTGRKQLLSVRCVLGPIPTSNVSVQYSINGGSLQNLGTFRVVSGTVAGTVATTIAFPPLTVAKKVAYYISFSAGPDAFAPELLSLTTTYQPWTAKSSGSGGGGASGDRKNSNGSASSNGSGAGGGSGSGGGVGGGAGSGSGQGTGSGRGSGSTDLNGSVTGAGSTSAAATLPAAVAASGAAENAAQTVSGYAFKASGRAGGGEGGGSPSGGLGLPFLPVSGGVAGVALLLLVGPWAERRRLRLFTRWDPNVPRPFPAERTTDMPRRPRGRRPSGVFIRS
jgi:hypothetical protein